MNKIPHKLHCYIPIIFLSALFIHIVELPVVTAQDSRQDHFQKTKYTDKNFIPECHQILPSLVIRDPEFNQEEMMAVWRVSPQLKASGAIKNHGSVYISHIDKYTGDFLLDEQVKIDDTYPVPQASVKNGPEWANSLRGWEIFYSCYSKDIKTVRLCKISRNQLTAWYVSALPDSDGKGLIGASNNFLSQIPNIYYQNYYGSIIREARLDQGQFGWRHEIEGAIDITLPPEIREGKWMPDGNSIVHVK